jgi:hypothetical protein
MLFFRVNHIRRYRLRQFFISNRAKRTANSASRAFTFLWNPGAPFSVFHPVFSRFSPSSGYELPVPGKTCR